MRKKGVKGDLPRRRDEQSTAAAAPTAGKLAAQAKAAVGDDALSTDQDVSERRDFSASTPAPNRPLPPPSRLLPPWNA